MLAFDVVDGRRRNAEPCAQLFYDEDARTWSAEVADWAAVDDVPMLFIPFLERGQRSIEPRWAERFVEERIVPPGRQNLGEVLRAHGLDEYDELPLLASSQGRSAQDDFVLKGPYPWTTTGDGVQRGALRAACGRSIAQARKEAGLTQKQLAERVGIDQAVLSRVERGRTNATLGLLEDIASALGRTVDIALV